MTSLVIEKFSNDPDLRRTVFTLARNIAFELNNINQGSLHLGVYRVSPKIKPHYDQLYQIYKEAAADKGVADLIQLVPQLDWVVPMSNLSLEQALGGMVALDAMAAHPGIDYYATQSDKLELPVSFSVDRYGLTEVNERMNLQAQGIIIGDNLVYYHPFLRRFFRARFVDTPLMLSRILSDGKVKLKIALDPIRYSQARNLDQTMEFDQWYGVYFDKSKLDDPKYRGVTVHARNDPTGRLEVTFPLLKTIFYITDYKNGEKEFQIEELVPTSSRVSAGDKYVLHRFAHFIWNKELQAFRHFDCATLIYTKQEHAKRLRYDWKNSDQSGYARAYKRKKLFRLDGEIGVEEVKNLLYSFFRYNELVMEYFGAEPEGLERS